MLLATVLTIVLSASYQAVTETKITKMEEDSQKALAAAEAGIEYSLKSGTTVKINNLNGFTNFTGKTEIEDSTTTGTDFSTPLINKDSQYTFYLADYQTGSFTNAYSGTITVYWQQDSTGACDSSSRPPALELTFIYGDSPVKIKKYAYEPCPTAPTKIEGNNLSSFSSVTKKVDGVDYQLKTDAITVDPDAKLLIVRPLYNGTKIGFEGSNPLRLQGTYINSTASTPGKTTKTVRVFHSLPQIRTAFFVTQF